MDPSSMGRRPRRRPVRTALCRVVTLLADLIEPARSTALDKLDEGRHALTIATAWLRCKANKPIPPIEPESTL
jgi:hypothetical protein